MKTLKKENEYIRVDDKKADTMVNEHGWSFSPKQEWKEWKKTFEKPKKTKKSKKK